MDNNKNLKKIDELKLLLLSNDSFITKEIKYNTFVEDKNSLIHDKYLFIYNIFKYLFKDEEMTDILNIIPLISVTSMFEFII